VTIVDFDQVCITNTNRQLHALSGMVGEFKAEVLAERFRKINPQAVIEARVQFYNEKTSDELLGIQPDFVIDAIDNVTAKCHLLATCRARGIPVVSSSGSGGRLDPASIRIADLAETEVDPLARAIRRILREKYAFPVKGSFGIPTVYSTESVIEPKELAYDNGRGFKCVCPQGQNGLNDCDMKNQILGNTAFVTATFGNFCASVVVRELLSENPTAQ
jgi:tRNA A37 threonylcarbamoyladenosine dehydratase